MRLALVRLVVAVATAELLGCSRTAAPPETPSRATVTHVGDTTLVSIDESTQEPVNPDCVAYCERLERCRNSVPGVDVLLDAKSFMTRCRAEHDDCRTPTTETLCCSRLTDCSDFGHCQARSRDLVQACTAR